MGKMPFILLIAFIMLSSAAGCEQDVPAAVGQEIEDHLNTIVSNPAWSVSSNPHDYIKNNQQAFDSILSHGNRSLDYLTKQLNASEQSGLKEWIMAQACVDILKDSNPVKQWSTGKEWAEKYARSQS
jgi:hypothetical protein